jgi:23S rRNA (cytosine1962-C5)-methyltransferase
MLANLPQPNTRRISLHVTPAAERALKQGHPWLFADGITKQSHVGQAGDFAVVFDKRDKFMALGLYDPESPVRVKVLHHGRSTPIEAAWFAAKIQQAAQIRQPLIDAGTTGYRLIYGENDGLPSLIADRYADTLVLKLYSAIWLPHLPVIVPALVDTTNVARIVLRMNRLMQQGDTCGLRDGQVIYGDVLPDAPLVFVENGLRFAADVQRGHKTGFFFDHRDNRQRVRELAQGRRVLDVFAYVGAFSLYAAAGGATEITSVDVSAPALQAAQHNFTLNQHLPQVAAAKHTTIAGDAFAALETMQREKRQFEMVVVDPPTFTGNTEHVPRALESYRRLVHLSLPLVAKQGIFVMASCSSRIPPEVFFDTVQMAARQAGYKLDEIARTGHALDHPIGFPEGAYLKCMFAKND